MSQENVEIMRQSISMEARSRRGLEERLFLRFPRLHAFVFRTVWRLPPRSRIRQAVLRRGVQLGVESTNRLDYSAGLMLYAEDGETVYPPELVSVGFEARTQGRAARADFQRRWSADWGRFRYELEELIDLGEQFLILGRAVGVGGESGVPFDREIASLFTVESGAVVCEQFFLTHAEALEAAGLSE